jgi:hypothetical protein
MITTSYSEEKALKGEVRAKNSKVKISFFACDGRDIRCTRKEKQKNQRNRRNTARRTDPNSTILAI